jgi:hypothetical protein
VLRSDIQDLPLAITKNDEEDEPEDDEGRKMLKTIHEAAIGF